MELPEKLMIRPDLVLGHATFTSGVWGVKASPTNLLEHTFDRLIFVTHAAVQKYGNKVDSDPAVLRSSRS